MSRAMRAGTAGERHAQAVAQTADWARAAAEEGNLQEALSWLRVIEAVDGFLADELRVLRDRCLALVGQRAAEHSARRLAGEQRS